MHRESAEHALKTATRMLKATDKWLAWAHGLHAVHVAAGMFEREDYNTDSWREDMIAQDREYSRTNKRPMNPSKNHKHRMYAEVYRAAMLADVEVAPGSIRDLDGIRAVLARVTAALAAPEPKPEPEPTYTCSYCSFTATHVGVGEDADFYCPSHLDRAFGRADLIVGA